MLKSLTSGTAVIAYGSDLPDAATAYDGQLFYKIGTSPGLYVFSFNQDSNSTNVGDQVSQGWSQATASDLYVQKTGDTMSGDLTIQSGGTTRGVRLVNLTNTSGGSVSVGLGTNQGITISSDNGPMNFNAGNTQRMSLSSAGNLTLTTSAGTGTVFTNLNDGSGSGMDADLLDGQDGTFYRSATNINTGTLDVARLPFTPVQQGGGTSQLPNKVYIGYNGSQLGLQIDSSNFGATWPINISGLAATASSAVNATNATNAVNSQYLRNSASASGQAMTFSYSGSASMPAYCWGTQGDPSTNSLFDPRFFAVSRIWVNGTPNSGVSHAFQYQQQGQLAYFWMTNDSSNSWVVTPSSVTVGGAGYATNAGTVNNIDGHLPNIRNNVMPYANNGDLGTLIAAIFNNVPCGTLAAALSRCGYFSGGGPGPNSPVA